MAVYTVPVKNFAAGSTITGQDGFVEVSYSYANPVTTQTDFAFTATVPTAIPDGTLYVRTRISEPYTADLQKNFAVNTTTSANTRVYTVAIEVAAE